MVLKAMKKCLKKKCQEKHFCQEKIFGKGFLEFRNFLKFQSLEMFQSSCEKQFGILNTNFKMSVSHLGLGWKFEPRPKWPTQ